MPTDVILFRFEKTGFDDHGDISNDGPHYELAMSVLHQMLKIYSYFPQCNYL